MHQNSSQIERPTLFVAAPPSFSKVSRQARLYEAASDFFFLQNRGYPRESALEWAGNRYELRSSERQILRRGVFSQHDALLRRSRRCLGGDWRAHPLYVDGHNVHITVESGIRGRPLLLANDGALRDIAGESSGFRFSEISEMAIDMVFRFLQEFFPSEVVFLFDAPMSHSGSMANAYRRRMKSMGIRGDARTAAVPDKELPERDCVVASSDHAVIDRSSLWFDLARAVLEVSSSMNFCADFSSFLLSRQSSPCSPAYQDAGW